MGYIILTVNGLLIGYRVVRRPKSYDVLYWVPSGKFENMSGKYQGILREKNLGQRVGTLVW